MQTIQVIRLVAVAFAVGVAGAGWVDIGSGYWAVGGGALAAFTFLCRRGRRSFRVLALLCVVCLGGAAAAWQREWWADWIAALSAWDTVSVEAQVIGSSSSGRWLLKVTRLCSADRFPQRCYSGRLPQLQLRPPSDEGWSPVAGGWVEAFGTLHLPQAAANPGGYDPVANALRLGQVGELRAQRVIEATGEAPPLAMATRLVKARERWRQLILGAIPGEAGALAASIALGGSTDLSEASLDDLQRAGLMHVTAVSGLHVSLIVGACWLILGQSSGYGWLGVALGLLFVLLTGGRASSMRAIIGAGVALAARQAGLQSDPWLSLAVAGLGILVGNPALLTDAGFLLSFAGVAGIIAISSPLLSAIAARIRWGPCRRWLCNALAVTLGAQLGTAFLAAYYFNTISLVGPLVNLVGVPLATATLLPALAGCLVESVWSLFGQPMGSVTLVGRGLFAVAGWAARLLIAVAHTAAGLPWAALEVATPVWTWGVAWFCLLCGLSLLLKGEIQSQLSRFASLRRARWCWLGAGLAIVCAMLGADYDHLTITFLSVGQGDAIVLEAPGGYNVLIDAGGASRSWDGSRVLLPFMRRRGIRDLAAVFVTHPHADHIGGMAGVIAQRQVQRALDSGQETMTAAYRRYRDAIQTSQVPRTLVRAGDRLVIGEVYVDVLWPPHDDRLWRSSDLNGGSVVLRVSYRDVTVILTGDAPADAQEAIMRREQAIPTVLWKVSHQGAGDSFHPGFVDWLQPQVSVMSVGPNSYGHPAASVVDVLESIGTLCRTDEHGAVQFVTDGQSWWVGGTKGTGCRARG